MKNSHLTNLMITGLAIAAGASIGSAGQVIISNFDDPNDASLWTWESWSDPASTEFAADQDAGGGGAGSGSMKVINSFPERPTGYSQAVVTLNLGQNVDAETLYTNISLDVKLDPTSYPRVNGTDYGGLELIVRNGSAWTWSSLGFYELTAANTNWTHLNFPIKAPADAVHHLTLKLGENNLTNTVTYYVDNVRWDEAALQIPPPTMSIEKTQPGLNLLAASGGQYDRQGIATLNGNFGWVGSTAPVSYSMTIKSFPSAVTYPGFSTRFFLVPGSPGNEEYPDWTEATCIIVDMAANTNGGGSMTFHYKTNAPNSNGINNQYFNNNPTNGPVGQLGSVTGASILGTWTVTMNQDTNITLTAPDGTTSSMVMPPEDAAQFAGDIKVYFAAVPGVPGNIGQRAILSRVQIKSGSEVLLDDNFTTEPLNPDVWVTRAASPAGVSLITKEEPFYIYWTTPASGFTLQFTPDLKNPNWTDPGLTDQLVGLQKRVLVPSSVATNAIGFFRLVKVAQ